jgi:FkbM family methyltransferase
MFGRTKKDETAVRLKPDTTTEQPRATTDHSGATTERPGALTPEHVVWAYRLLLDREPESDAVIGPKLAGSRDTSQLRHHLMTSAEFQQKNRDYAHTNDRTIVIKELDGVPGGVRLFVDLSDHVIGLNIVRGRYEQDEIRYLRTLLKAGDTVIDAGAHIGFFTMQIAAMVGPAGKVYAFEPFGPNAELLEQSVVENRFSDRVVFQQAALGSASGTATLTFPVETLNSGGAYLLRDGTLPLAGNLRKSVPLVALDDVALRRPVRLIKMDVEGAEPQVIRGAARLLKEDRPIILSELHPTQLERASGVGANEFLAEVRAFGYRAHLLQGSAEAGHYDHDTDARDPNAEARRHGHDATTDAGRRNPTADAGRRDPAADAGRCRDVGAVLERAPAEALVSVVFLPSER